MQRCKWFGLATTLLLIAAGEPPRTGQAAFGDWHDDAPGVARHI
jgi:hypothetical protein